MKAKVKKPSTETITLSRDDVDRIHQVLERTRALGELVNAASHNPSSDVRLDVINVLFQLALDPVSSGDDLLDIKLEGMLAQKAGGVR